MEMTTASKLARDESLIFHTASVMMMMFECDENGVRWVENFIMKSVLRWLLITFYETPSCVRSLALARRV